MRNMLLATMPLGGGAAPAWDPATDDLSLWLRTDSVTGTTSTLSWASKASAGSSGSAAAMVHSTSYGDTVEQPSTSLDGFASVLWTGAYPALETANLTRTLLGAGDSTPASYTAAYVMQPVASNQCVLDGGGKVDVGNPCVFADLYGNLAHVIMSDAGTCKVGVHHRNEDTATGGGSSPATWPGGFGAWGLMWVSYTSGGNVRVRVNGTNLTDETIVTNQGPSGTDAAGWMGSLGGGAAVPEFRLVEMMLWPGQALTGTSLTDREAGYFATRYPSLGL